MPNILVSLNTEITRVKALLPRLNVFDRTEAEGMLRFANIHIAQNNYEGMQESLQDLAAFRAYTGKGAGDGK